jgi:DUF1680 family protein
MLTADALRLRIAAPDDGSARYIGHWTSAGRRRFTDLACQRCRFTFSGGEVEAWVVAGPDRGICEVLLDGRKVSAADCYARETGEVCICKQGDLDEGVIHNLVLVSTGDKNAQSAGALIEPACFKARNPVDYRAELKRQYFTEYEIIKNNEKTWKPFETWKPVPFRALMPERGVRLTGGIVRRLFDLNIAEIKYDFALPHYCEGGPNEQVPEEDLRKLPGWSGWLCGSNEGRLLAGAALSLRWEEDPELRALVSKITGDIRARMRDDGYHNYYPEENSYARVHTIEEWVDRGSWCRGNAEYSERKNYDRVFWTRGLLAAMMSGDRDAGVLLRRFYDWFNTQEKYLVNMVRGANSPNGRPGGPLVYLSPAGRPGDLITSMRYLDEDYWIKALGDGQPLAPVDYPGDRPHCYTLLTLEAIADEYLATGDEKYYRALMGGWKIYHDHYRHTGGFISIGELSGPHCAPDANYISTHLTGETCGQVFWAWINQRLMQLYPREERYIAQVEETLYNTLVPGKTEGKPGNAGYLSLQGKRGGVDNYNGCCQVSACMAAAAAPQWIYMIGGATVYVNLFVASSFESPFGTITMETDFPCSGRVLITVDPLPLAGRFDLSVRVPCWARGELSVNVNDSFTRTGQPGGRVDINRHWQKGDRLSFTLPYGPRLYRYTGADQIPGRTRYTMLCGPVLMALTDPLCTGDKDPGGGVYVPHIPLAPEELLKSLRADPANPLRFPAPVSAAGLKPAQAEYAFVPYWDAPAEGFSCVPSIGP